MSGTPLTINQAGLATAEQARDASGQSAQPGLSGQSGRPGKAGPSRAERACGLAEGLCLSGLAGAIWSLWAGDTLWYFINPKYQAVVLAAAAAMAALGVFAALVPPRPARFSRPLVFAALIGLCYFGGADELFKPQPGQGVLSGMAAPAEEPALPSRAVLAGREFIRINVGELYDISAAHLEDKIGLNYLVQGYVSRKGDEAMLYRTALYCCFADSTAVAFRLKADAAKLPADGTWVQVYGRLEKTKPGKPPKLDLGGGFSSVNPDYALAAERIEEIPAPKPPFMFEWRTEEPYAF
jgi:hypothetical protein